MLSRKSDKKREEGKKTPSIFSLGQNSSPCSRIPSLFSHPPFLYLLGSPLFPSAHSYYRRHSSCLSDSLTIRTNPPEKSHATSRRGEGTPLEALCKTRSYQQGSSVRVSLNQGLNISMKELNDLESFSHETDYPLGKSPHWNKATGSRAHPSISTTATASDFLPSLHKKSPFRVNGDRASPLRVYVVSLREWEGLTANSTMLSNLHPSLSLLQCHSVAHGGVAAYQVDSLLYLDPSSRLKIGEGD